MATAPAATAATWARRRNHVSRSPVLLALASAMRNTAERYAQTSTASTPPRIDVGLIQLEMASPFPAVGTRPDATPPATVPRKKGVITDEAANIAPLARCAGVRTETFRKANPEPRRTMPNAASPSG